MSDAEKEPQSTPQRSERCGLSFQVAERLDDVLAAWELVYHAYRRISLVDANEQELHTVPQAVGEHSTVIIGSLDRQVVSTLTMIHDSIRGLPLDCVYREQLDTLRGAGKRLMEVGLFADRREQMTRSLPAVLEMMRYVFWRSQFSEHHDIVAGVHPHHAAFYQKYFGFEIAGPETVHPTVKDHAVVFLHLDLRAQLQRSPLCRGLAMYVADPLSAEVFGHRFRFDLPAASHPRIAGFLRDKYGPSFQFKGVA